MCPAHNPIHHLYAQVRASPPTRLGMTSWLPGGKIRIKQQGWRRRRRNCAFLGRSSGWGCSCCSKCIQCEADAAMLSGLGQDCLISGSTEQQHPWTFGGNRALYPGCKQELVPSSVCVSSVAVHSWQHRDHSQVAIWNSHCPGKP